MPGHDRRPPARNPRQTPNTPLPASQNAQPARPVVSPPVQRHSHTTLTPAGVLQLQKQLGNRAVTGLLLHRLRKREEPLQRFKDAITSVERQVQSLTDAEVVHYWTNPAQFSEATEQEKKALQARYDAVQALTKYEQITQVRPSGFVPGDESVRTRLLGVVDGLWRTIGAGNTVTSYQGNEATKQRLQKVVSELKQWSKKLGKYPGAVLNFQAFLIELGTAQEAVTQHPQVGMSSGAEKFPYDVDQVVALASRVCALPKVTLETDMQTAKQTNVALAKMLNALNSALSTLPLQEGQRRQIQGFKQRVEKRIVISTKNSGADFKSCDSALIDLETQVKRAEAKVTSPSEHGTDKL